MTSDFLTKFPYKYTIGFVYCAETSEILMLNRQKAPWMGRWNGVGGKLEANETPYESIVRETVEEAGLNLPQYVSRGILEWVKQGMIGGAYLFTAELSKEERDKYVTPTVFCNEGILDWKKIDWLMHPDNVGVVPNVRLLLQYIFEADNTTLFRSFYNDAGDVPKFEKTVVTAK